MHYAVGPTDYKLQVLTDLDSYPVNLNGRKAFSEVECRSPSHLMCFVETSPT